MPKYGSDFCSNRYKPNRWDSTCLTHVEKVVGTKMKFRGKRTHRRFQLIITAVTRRGVLNRPEAGKSSGPDGTHPLLAGTKHGPWAVFNLVLVTADIGASRGSEAHRTAGLHKDGQRSLFGTNRSVSLPYKSHRCLGMLTKIHVSRELTQDYLLDMDEWRIMKGQLGLSNTRAPGQGDCYVVRKEGGTRFLLRLRKAFSERPSVG